MPRKKKTTHSSGLYRKRITLGYDGETGKPVVKAVYGRSQAELEEKISKLRIDKGMGVVVTNGRNTWAYWAAAWKQLTEPSVSTGTWKNYEAILKHLAVFNSEKVSHISSMDIQALIANKFQAGYSKQTLKVMLEVMSRVFQLARRNHAIGVNPCEDVTVPRNAPVTERQAVPEDVQERLWSLRPMPVKCPSDALRNNKMAVARMFALMQLNCGLRREEAVALTWKNVDLRQRTVKIDCAYDFKAKRLKTPKSSAGNREIPVPERYLTELKQWRKTNKGTFAAEKWVFSYNGKQITESVFRSLWDVLLDGINGISFSDRVKDGIRTAKAGKATNKVIPKGRRHEMYRSISFTSHQLRHTYATNCIAAGIDVRTVQYLMGHSTPTMALHYTHLTENSIETARERLNDYNSDSAKKDNNACKSGQ